MEQNSAFNMPHRQPYQPRKKANRKSPRLLPALMLLVILVLLAGVIFATVSRLFSGKASCGGRAVELDEGWTARFLMDADTETQKHWLDEALSQAADWGADTILWTARTPDGDTLFRSSGKEALTTAPTVTANDSFFKKFDPLEYLVQHGRKQGISVLLLATAPDGTALNIDQLMDYIAPSVSKAAKKNGIYLCAPAGTDEETNITVYRCVTQPGGQVKAELYRCDASPSRLLNALEQGQTNRLIVGSHTALEDNPTSAALLNAWSSSKSGMTDLSTYLGSEVPQILALSYPTTGVYTNSVFLMGTSDPKLPLNLSGGLLDGTVEVERGGKKGVWGYLVEVESGTNEFTLTQPGGESLPITVTCLVGVGGAGRTEQPQYTDQPAVWGQKIQITSGAAASALSDPTNTGSIQCTLYQGAVAAVYDSAEIKDGTSRYAYKLATGDYVLSKNVTLLDVDTPDPVFTDASVGFDSETNCTVLTLSGGTPAVYHQWEGNALALTFLTADYTGEAPRSEFFATSEVEPLDYGFRMIFSFSDSDPLYGWNVVYDTEANTTAIYLKHRPVLSDAETGPLTGVRVLLDAGHGGTDNGAMGSAGYNAPTEKNVNLAEAVAAKTRLEQLGATVLMSREDDTFPTLNDRLNQLNTLRPDFFIALHHNSASLSTDLNSSGGIESYWFYTEGKTLATLLAENIAASTGRRNRGTFYNYYFVTRSNICPAVLLESGFMTCPAEYENVTDQSTIWAEAGAIAQSILQCVTDGN